MFRSTIVVLQLLDIISNAIILYKSTDGLSHSVTTMDIIAVVLYFSFVLMHNGSDVDIFLIIMITEHFNFLQSTV